MSMVVHSHCCRIAVSADQSLALFLFVETLNDELLEERLVALMFTSREALESTQRRLVESDPDRTGPGAQICLLVSG